MVSKRIRDMRPNASNTMLCYTPGTDKVQLCAWPDLAGISDEYEYTLFACTSYVRDASFNTRKLIVFIEAVQAIVRDNVDPLALHRALLGLDEYRDGLADDALKPNPRL